MVFYRNQSLIAYNLSSGETIWRINDVVEYTVSRDDSGLVAILRVEGITIIDLFTNKSITYRVRGYTKIWICSRTLAARVQISIWLSIRMVGLSSTIPFPPYTGTLCYRPYTGSISYVYDGFY